MDLIEHKKKTVTGLKWNMISQVVTQIVTFGIGILLMRLLSPNDFGLIGMVTVFSGFVAIFKDFGLTHSLIQKKHINLVDKSTIFYANVIIGALLTIVLFVAAKYIASFYNSDQLYDITKTIAFIFIIKSLGMVHFALLKRKLEFKKIFYINSFTVIFGGAFSVYLALNNYGVWTLVYQQIITSLSSTILVWVINSWKPDFVFSFKALKSHLQFGLPLLVSSNITYWSRNVDNLLIGKFFSSQALGLYSRAYNLMMLPITQVSRVVSTVMLPSLSIIQEDRIRVKILYLKMARTIAFITFPMMGILFVATHPLIELVFGVKWLGIIPLLKLFAVMGASQSIGTLSGVIYISQAKTKLQFKVSAFNTTIIIIAFIIGVQISLYAIALAYLIAHLITLFPMYFYMGKIINLTLKKILLNILPHILIAIFLTILGVFTSNYIKDFINPFQIMILSIEYLVGWLILMKILRPKLFNEFLETLKEFKN